MTSSESTAATYSVEVSGWDADARFFVERAELCWDGDGDKFVSLGSTCLLYTSRCV